MFNAFASPACWNPQRVMVHRLKDTDIFTGDEHGGNNNRWRKITGKATGQPSEA